MTVWALRVAVLTIAVLLWTAEWARAQYSLGGMRLEGEIEAGGRFFIDEPSKTRAAKFQEYKDVDDGLFLLDAYGGSEAFVEMEEKRRVGGFTYVWDQHYYNPITGDAINYIHYRFADGSQIRKAFTYEWRVWTLPEIRELLSEAGFRKVTVYWEGVDEKTGQGNDEFNPATEGDACPGWIAYLVAER